MSKQLDDREAEEQPASDKVPILLVGTTGSIADLSCKVISGFEESKEKFETISLLAI